MDVFRELGVGLLRFSDQLAPPRWQEKNRNQHVCADADRAHFAETGHAGIAGKGKRTKSGHRRRRRTTSTPDPRNAGPRRDRRHAGARPVG